MLKGAVLTACIAGIISTIMKGVSTGDATKNAVKLIISIMLIASVIQPLSGAGYGDILNYYADFNNDITFESTADEFNELYISEAEQELEKELKQLLDSSGIEYNEISISCKIDEYNVIVIDTAEIQTETRFVDKARSLIGKHLPDINVIIKTAETDDERQ